MTAPICHWPRCQLTLPSAKAATAGWAACSTNQPCRFRLLRLRVPGSATRSGDDDLRLGLGATTWVGPLAGLPGW
jgi:hypothetical protein